MALLTKLEANRPSLTGHAQFSSGAQISSHYHPRGGVLEVREGCVDPLTWRLEIYPDVDDYCNWLPTLLPRLESPLLNSLDCFFI